MIPRIGVWGVYPSTPILGITPTLYAYEDGTDRKFRNVGTNPSTQILGITSTLYACEDGTYRKFRNVGTKSSDAGRLPKKHNTAFNTRRKFEVNIKIEIITSELILRFCGMCRRVVWFGGINRCSKLLLNTFAQLTRPTALHPSRPRYYPLRLSILVSDLSPNLGWPLLIKILYTLDYTEC